ncbi:hypothetical protein K505DRAFT_343610 [Melanomma pulvis-pyrius CBS 109.77]|uniref:Uncharacterized protein n=1 Tax=Melanomma pulvis-pyrius CBS 109.77 TaxID=1314802 RepID=A0A6A6WRS8_9PLEO|nr:hypothetical protein K505DRAFT_343610 [Melanomma pulvis-pyrius CBS 109.77]
MEGEAARERRRLLYEEIKWKERKEQEAAQNRSTHDQLRRRTPGTPTNGRLAARGLARVYAFRRACTPIERHAYRAPRRPNRVAKQRPPAPGRGRSFARAGPLRSLLELAVSRRPLCCCCWRCSQRCPRAAPRSSPRSSPSSILWRRATVTGPAASDRRRTDPAQEVVDTGTPAETDCVSRSGASAALRNLLPA